MAVHFHFVEQGSDKWHEGREGMYTGSNAYKLLGNIGIAEYAKAVRSDFNGNFWTKRGHVLEDEAIELYQEITGRVGIRDENGNRVGFVTNDKFTRCLYSPDDVYPDELIEVKSFKYENHMKLVRGADLFDIDYKIAAQIHYGFMVTRLRRGKLLAYCPMMAELQIENDEGVLIDNPYYDPANALCIIPIKCNMAIVKNFENRIRVAEKTLQLERG